LIRPRSTRLIIDAEILGHWQISLTMNT